MNDEATAESQAAPETPESSDPAPSAGGGLPSWLPYFLLAVVPAVLVGVLVFAFAGGSDSSGSNAAGIVEVFLAPSEDSNTRVESFEGALPSDFPADFPVFAEAETVVSFAVTTPQGRTYRAVLTSSSTPEEIFTFYRDQLDADPWQVEVGQIGSLVTGIQFARPDNPDISGVVLVNETKLGEDNVIQLIYEDLSGGLAPGTGPSLSVLGESLPLPPGFPEAVPIYGGDGGTIVIDSGFQRAQGGQLFVVTFLTMDPPNEVVTFYKDEFEARDWTVTDTTSTATTSFAVGIDFDDDGDSLSGQLVADTYEEDADYTRVDLRIQVSGRSN